MALTVYPCLAIDGNRCWPKIVFCILIFAGFLSGCTTTPAAENNDQLFEHYEFLTVAAKRQTIMSGFFLGGETAELAVVYVAENGHRRLQMFGLRAGAWVSVLEAAIRPQVMFVDMAHIGGRDRLITYESGRLNWFDPEAMTERKLVSVRTNYNAAEEVSESPTHPGADIPQIDISRDLNGDDRDDLIIPDLDGFWISIQLSDGSFADVVKLGPPEPFLDVTIMDQERSYRDMGISAATIPVYLRRVHQLDYDRDGKIDLVFWHDDHFDIHLQDQQGRFDAVAETVISDVPFESDGVYSRASDYIDVGTFAQLFGFNENSERVLLYSFRDLNGDQVADMVTLTLAGRTMFKQRSLYEVRFGTPTHDDTVFSRDVGTAIHPRGRAGAAQPWGYSSQSFQDFDGDGQIDIMFRDVDMGFGGMARALIGNSVKIDLEFYRMEGGVYPDEPTTTRRIKRFDPLDGPGNVFLPAVLLGDVNGDGRSDLLVGHSPEELRVFLGVPGPGLFARRPRKLPVALPSDERNTWLKDINKDGKQDVIIYHPRRDSTTEPHRLITLIAQ